MRALLLGFFMLLMSPGLEASEWIWKRSRILEADLARALALPREDLCHELGLYSCFTGVHLFALGGNDAVGRSQYTPLEQPTQLSAIAVERVVSQACLQRIALDAETSAPVVFTSLKLQQTIAEQSETAVRAQIRSLSQRFLQRDPRAEEEQLLLHLADPQRFGALPARDLAHGLCLAFGSQLEFLFF